TLLLALRRMLDRFPDLEPHPRLIVAGAQGWLSESLFGQVHDLRLSQEVAFVGSVSQEELVWLYNAARFLVFPSLYEGFGLPPLEAMACGTPVIASRAASLPEIVGDGGLLYDPDDTTGMAEGLLDVLTDVPTRAALAEKALAQARRFSWARTAEETLRAYEFAVGR
ncbi:MAG: glycosyltransferase family 1 protein, partial [Anaerolineae bacterium]|nr:glycosyltransferase family 1 protein [Anaerolineae bacterium]